MESNCKSQLLITRSYTEIALKNTFAAAQLFKWFQMFWDITEYFEKGWNILRRIQIFCDQIAYPLDNIQPLPMKDALDQRPQFIANCPDKLPIHALLMPNLAQKAFSDPDTNFFLQEMRHNKELTHFVGGFGVSQIDHFQLREMQMRKKVFVYEWCRTWCGVSRPDRRLSPQIVR